MATRDLLNQVLTIRHEWSQYSWTIKFLRKHLNMHKWDAPSIEDANAFTLAFAVCFFCFFHIAIHLGPFDNICRWHTTRHRTPSSIFRIGVSISKPGQYILHSLNALFIRGVNEYACNDCCRFCNLTTSHQTFEQRPCAFQKFTNRALHGHIYLFFSNLIFFAYRTIKMTLALKQCTKKEQRTLRTSRATPDLP